MKSTNDILVVGAGPVGLTMAAELRRHGVGCRLIERLAEPSPHCKALGITPRTLEMWDDLGIVNQALAAGLAIRGLINIANGDIENVEESSVALADGAYGFLTLAQYEAERILAEHLASLGGVIERGVELVELNAHEQSVHATLKHADGSAEQVHSIFLVGCDGGRSAVRHALKLPFEGDHYEQVFLLADVDLDWPLRRGFAYKLARFDDGKMQGAGACIPVPGNPRRYRISTVAPESMIPQELAVESQPEHGIRDLGPTLAQVQEVLDWLFPTGAKASNMRWSAFYRVSHRLVSQYRVGPVFLAGDAAHLHPPLGGQGMNTGMQDAYNLAWKLALAMQGMASPDLLDSYHAERRAIGLEIVERTTTRMNHVLEGNVDEQEPVREDSQLFLNYRGSACVANDIDGPVEQARGPLAGDRVPDVQGLRRSQVHFDARFFDLLRGPHHTLLFYTNHSSAEVDCRELAALAERLRSNVGSRIQAYAVLHPDCADPTIEGLPSVIDSRHEFARLYGAQRGSGYLIRPDGYIGYRGQPLRPERLLEYLKRILRLSM